MIIGAEYADRDYYSQENNAIDCYNKKAHPNSGYLESCGPSAMINCCCAISPVELFTNINGVPIQPEDAVWSILNNSNNYNDMLPYREGATLYDLNSKIIPSRSPQFFVWASLVLFNIKSEFHWNFSKDFNIIIDHLKNKRSIQLQLISPAHYISVAKYDTEEDVLLYEDSWYSRWPDKNGRNRKLTREEFSKNIHTFYNVYFPKEQQCG